MSKPVTLLIAVLLSLPIFAQKGKDVPEFGKVDKADLEMMECEFDKKAQAMILFEVSELYLNVGIGTARMEEERHIRIKILNDKGFGQADIHIPYRSYRAQDQIKNLTAQTYNLDANGNIVTTKVEKKLIYNKAINKKRSEEVFTFPEVRAGSIIEYKYTFISDGVFTRGWYFQRSIPVRYSRYRMDFPVELEINSIPLCVLPYKHENQLKGNRGINTYTMNNIPALRDEPYISCDNDYLQRLDSRFIAFNTPERRINLVRTWPGIIRELMEDEDFGVQLKRNIPHSAELDDQLKNSKDAYNKMVVIHNYVRKNMQWNGHYSIWALDGVRAAWKDHKGTIGEINLILVNLLKDAGIDAKPILVSTRENGRVNTSMAGFDQFNKVLAYVNIDKEIYVLDGTDKYTSPRLIPLDVMASEGLVIEKFDTYDWGWRTLWNPNQIFKDVIIFRADVNEQGQMKGEASISSYDYSRVQKMPDVIKGKEKFTEKYFTSANPALKLDSLTFENADAESMPLIQKVGFTMPVSASGDYKYFSLNLFSGLEKNPFIADNRFSDVFFGANQTISIIGYVNIPDGYVFEALPKSMRMIMPDTSISITRRIVSDKKQISVRITLEFKKPYYIVSEYEYFKEFYKKLFDILNEQIAIRKETNP